MVGAALQGEELGGVGHAGDAVVVGVVVAAVVGDIDGVAAAVAGGGTPVPTVGAVAVDQPPGAGTFKAVAERMRLVYYYRRIGSREGDHPAPGAVEGW